jgi:3-phosphoglycerate kinase
MDIGGSVIDKKVNIKKFLRNPKIILPIDVRKKRGAILDIGPLAVKELILLAKNSKFILWNGPLGNIYEKEFEKGTKEIARAVADSRARTIVGGGDTAAVIDKMGILKKFSFVSTAGGAMLEFLAKGTLPGIEALKKH